MPQRKEYRWYNGVMALLFVALMAPLAVCAQEVEVLYGHQYAAPEELIVHKEFVFCRYKNGQLARRGVVDTSWTRVGEVIRGFVDRIVQTDAAIWVYTSSGNVYGSSNAGTSWFQAEGRYACLGEMMGGSAVGVVDGQLFLLTISDERVEPILSPLSLPILHPAEMAVKGDTVILCLADRKTVITAVRGNVISRTEYDGPIARFTFGGSSTLHMLGYFFYRQAPSLARGFSVVNYKLGLASYFSVSQGTGPSGSLLIICGAEPSDLGFRIAVRIYRPDSLGQDQSMIYERVELGDTVTPVVSTLAHGRTYAISNFGETSYNEDNEWKNLNRRYMGMATRGVWNITRFNGQLLITQGINSLNRARPPLFREFTRDGVTEPLASNPDLLDSIESVLGYFPSTAGRKLIVGSQGWITNEPDDSSYTLGGRRDIYSVHQFDNGELLASHGFRGMALSSDTGRTWTHVAHRPLIHGGYIPAFRNDSLYVLSSVNGRWVLRSNQDLDTFIVKSLPSTISGGFTVFKSSGLHFEVVGAYTDTLGRTYVRFENYLYDSLIASHNVFVGGMEMLGPIVYSNADTVKLFFHYTMELLTFVGRELLSRRSYMTRVTEQFQYASQNNVFWLSSDSIRILRPSEGVAITIVLRDSVVSSVDQGIWHFYLENVHPNPAENTISVDVGKYLTADRSTVRLQLWAIDGKMIQDYTHALPTFGNGNEKRTVHLDVSTIPNGMYLLVVKNSQITRSEKVVIRR